MKVVIFILFAVVPDLVFSSRSIEFTNRCQEDIWIAPLTNNQGPILAPGIKKISRGSSFSYQIPNGGWGGRFWPKMGCDGSGNSCRVGQSVPPCPSTGCQPPAETKVEFFFPRLGDGKDVWYDISLVDGYSIAAEITPSKIQGTCTKTNCALSLNKCPNENEVGDLRVVSGGRTTMCLSPCKKWNYPA